MIASPLRSAFAISLVCFSSRSRDVYYFFMLVVVIRYRTKATARRALAFIVRIFVNDTIAIAVWTSFHMCVYLEVNA